MKLHNIFLLLFFLILSFVNTDSAYSQVLKNDSALKKTKFYSQENSSKIKLETSILKTENAEDDGVLRPIFLTLKLQFTNQGNVPVLLYERAFRISSLLIGENVEKLISGDIEYDLVIATPVTSRKNTCCLNLQGFVILPVNGKYEAETTIEIFVPYDSAKKITGSISIGNHVLQLTAYKWNIDKKEIKRKQKRLQKYGKIRIVSITSTPMEFTTK